MPLTRPSPALAAAPTTVHLPRQPGAIEAVLILLMLAGKISFWLPVPIIGMNLSPFAFMLLILAFFGLSFRMEDLRRALATSQPLLIGLMIVVIMLLIAFVMKDNALYGQLRIVNLIEKVIAVYLAAMIFVSDQNNFFKRIMAWAGPLMALYFFFLLLAAQQFNPVSVLTLVLDGIRSGNTNFMIWSITYTVVTGTDETLDFNEFGVNTRHGWSSALLVSLLLSMLHIGHQGRNMILKFAWLGLIGLNVLLLILLLSRGVLLGAASGLLVSLLLPMRGKGIQIAAFAGVGIVMTIIVIVSGFAGIFIDQFFGNTGSYTERLGGYGEAFRRISENVVFGADESYYGVTAHNLIIDAWQGAGVIAMVGALVAIAYFGLEIARLVISPPASLKHDTTQIFAVVAFVSLGAFVVIRHLTAGYGLIDRHEAFAAGVFVAWAYRFRMQVSDEAAAAAERPKQATRPRRSLADRRRERLMKGGGTVPGR